MIRDFGEFEIKDRKSPAIDILYNPSNPNEYYLQFGIEKIDNEVIDL